MTSCPVCTIEALETAGTILPVSCSWQMTQFLGLPKDSRLPRRTITRVLYVYFYHIDNCKDCLRTRLNVVGFSNIFWWILLVFFSLLFMYVCTGPQDGGCPYPAGLGCSGLSWSSVARTQLWPHHLLLSTGSLPPLAAPLPPPLQWLSQPQPSGCVTNFQIPNIIQILTEIVKFVFPLWHLGPHKIMIRGGIYIW